MSKSKGSIALSTKRIKVDVSEMFVMDIRRGKQKLGELIIHVDTLEFQLERNTKTGEYKSTIKISITNPSDNSQLQRTEYTGQMKHF